MDAFFAFLPYALLFLLCPLMMLFMHRGDGHESHDASHAEHRIDAHSAELARRLPSSKDEATT